MTESLIIPFPQKRESSGQIIPYDSREGVFDRIPVYTGMVIAIVLLLFIAADCAAQTRFKAGSVTIATKFRDISFRVEVADTNRLKSIGLMYRSSMPEERGMLLLNEKPQRMNIWMKNTFIPLDIIYIDKDGHIVKIVENARTESTTLMPSGGKVKAVLELNAGQVRQQEIAIGDRVTYRVD